MACYQICPWCLQTFTPHPRLGKRQRCCGRADCKQKQKNLSHKEWKLNHSDIYLANQKDWHVAHPDYWQGYRLTHPEYTQRNRDQTRARKALSLATTGLQKRIDILQLAEVKDLFWDIPRFVKSPRSLTPLLYAYASRHEYTPSHGQSAPP